MSGVWSGAGSLERQHQLPAASGQAQLVPAAAAAPSWPGELESGDVDAAAARPAAPRHLQPPRRANIFTAGKPQFWVTTVSKPGLARALLAEARADARGAI